MIEKSAAKACTFGSNVAMSAGGLVMELPLTTPPYDSTKISKR
jgi:hypothetical protein